MTADTMEMNNQVLLLWREQSRTLEQAPEVIANHVDGIGNYLTTLHEMAGGNEKISGMIQSIWSMVQGIQTASSSQSMVINTAGIIIPALKIQRDELALEMAKLLQVMGLAEREGSTVNGLITGLYDAWREALDTTDIEAGSQDELLDVIYGDIEGRWGLPDDCGVIVLGALRGHTDLTPKQEKAFMVFLKSLGGDS